MEKGCILDNKYEIIDILGTGGMGRVYLAKNIMLGTLWTIKELRKNPCDIDRILTEVDVLKNLEHPALPKVFDVLESNEFFFVVFSYIKGIALDKKLLEVGRFDEGIVVNFAICLCDVLIYLHTSIPKPIIYRDLKPSNIILCDDGNIKLIDFGIAREFKEENTQDTVFIGTRGYAAPEQYGEGQSGPYTDIFSLGITLKQLLTGKSPLSQPYGILPVTQLNPQVSKKLEQILEKCTKKEINKRYDSVSELKDELVALSMEVNQRVRRGRAQPIIITEKKAFFKQIIISLNNGEFISELAIAASFAGMTVLLIDLVKFTPVCDFYLGIQKQYKEHRVMMEIETSGLNSIDVCANDINRYIYKLPQIEGLSYLSVDIVGMNADNTSTFLNRIKDMFDLVVINTSLDYLETNTKVIFNSADRIVIADKIYLDHIDYWERTITAAFEKFDIHKRKVFYFGWLYHRDEGVLLKVAGKILKVADFAEGIALKSKRRNNINNSIGAAVLNYRESKKEYERILFYLSISPVGYVENSQSVFGFLREKRV